VNCDDVITQANAYALGALSAEETAAVEAHLATCPRAAADREVIATHRAMLLLAYDDPATAPPPPAGLGERIVAVAQTQAAPVTTDQLHGRPVALRRWFAGAAAVLLGVVLAAGLVAWLNGGGGAGLHYVYRADSGAELRIEGHDGDGPVTVTMAGFAPQAEGMAYQVWAIRGDAWLSIGICNTDEAGWWQGDFAFSLASGDEIALTVSTAEGGAAGGNRIALREVTPAR